MVVSEMWIRVCVMAFVGGALMPPIQATILDWGGPGFNDIQILGWIDEVNFSFLVPLIGLIVVTTYSFRSINYKIDKI